MQTQDAPAEILFKVWPWLEANAKRIGIIAVVLVLLVGVYCFVSATHQERETTAADALTQLLLTPSSDMNMSAESLLALAAKYDGTSAAKRAQLQAATSLYGIGKYPEAQAQFERYLAGGSVAPFTGIAELGLGASLEAQGKLPEASTAYQKATSGAQSASSLAANNALGRIAEAQGKLSEAASDYQAAANLGSAGGTVSQSAYFSLQRVKAKMAAAQPVATQSASSAAPAGSTSTSNSTPTFVFPSK